MIFFFTEHEQLLGQTDVQAYGPIKASNQYRVNSLHTTVGNASLYAVCDGQVLVVQSTDTNKLNLVLRPTGQVIAGFPKIKYFIFKGIDKRSLLNEGGEIADKNNNDLTKYLSDKFPIRGKEILILDPGAYPANREKEWLEAVFLSRETIVEVEMGMRLAAFLNSSVIGMQIVLERTGDQMTIGDLQAAADDPLTSVITPMKPADTLEGRAEREKILGFLDPCAFYGLMFHNGVKHKPQVDWTLEDAPVLTKEDLYHTFLKKKYFRPNIVYLDIRNDLGYSMNFFGNYDAQEGKVQIAKATDQPAIAIEAATYGWPLLEIKFDPVSPGQKNSEKTYLKLNFPKGDIVKNTALLYLAYAYLHAGNQQPPQGRSRFIDLTFDSDFTNNKDVVLSTPRANTNNDGNVPVAGYIQVYYIKQIDQTQVIHDAPLANNRHYLNCLFPVLPEYIWERIPDSQRNHYLVFEELKYFDAREESTYKVDWAGMVKVGVGREKDGSMVFFSIPVDAYVAEEAELRQQAYNSSLANGYDVNRNNMLEVLVEKYFENCKQYYYVIRNNGQLKFIKSTNASAGNLRTYSTSDKSVVLCLGAASIKPILQEAKTVPNNRLFVPILRLSDRNQFDAVTDYYYDFTGKLKFLQNTNSIGTGTRRVRVLTLKFLELSDDIYPNKLRKMPGWSQRTVISKKGNQTITFTLNLFIVIDNDVAILADPNIREAFLQDVRRQIEISFSGPVPPISFKLDYRFQSPAIRTRDGIVMDFKTIVDEFIIVDEVDNTNGLHVHLRNNVEIFDRDGHSNVEPLRQGNSRYRDGKISQYNYVQVKIFPNTLPPYDVSPSCIRTFVHELGHTLGLNHPEFRDHTFPGEPWVFNIGESFSQDEDDKVDFASQDIVRRIRDENRTVTPKAVRERKITDEFRLYLRDNLMYQAEHFNSGQQLVFEQFIRAQRTIFDDSK